MDIKKILQRKIVQFFGTLALSFVISYSLVLCYWNFVDSNYLKLLILYFTGMFGFAALGFWVNSKYKKPFVSIPLFCIAFAWFSIYIAQRLSGADFFYEFKLKRASEEARQKKQKELQPELVKTLFDQGKNLLNSKNYKDAERNLLAAAELDSSNAEIYFTLSDLYQQMKNPYVALLYLDRGLMKDPQNSKYIEKYGLLSYSIGENRVALNAFKVAASIDTSLQLSQANYEALIGRLYGDSIQAAQGKLQVQQIILDSKETAEEVFNLVNNGNHFGSLAYKYSIDPTGKQNGGIGPFFNPNSNEYAFTNIVKKLRIGEISSIHELQGHYFIIRRIY